MLEKFVVTLTVSSVALTVGTTYAWAVGAFDPVEADFGTVAERVVEAPQTAAAETPAGYGTFRSRPRVEPTEEPTRRPPRAGQSPAPWQPVPVEAPPRAPLPLLAGAATSGAASTTPQATGMTAAPMPVSEPGATTAPAPTPAPTDPGTAAPGPVAEGGGDFTVASLNVLGHDHTKPGGNKPGWASSYRRMAAAKKVMNGHGVDVVGLQEFEPPQRREFQRLSPGWAQYPGIKAPPRSGADAVAWNTAVWKVREQHLIVIPYFHGERKKMPYVLLEHRATGKKLWVSSFHNPADARGPAQKWRNQATDRQVRLFNRLEATGHPQVVTGDMNEYRTYFCRITSRTPLKAAAGGSRGGTCKPPKNAAIDWIFGSPSLTFSDYQRDRGPAMRFATDHPLVVTDATFG